MGRCSGRWPFSSCSRCSHERRPVQARGRHRRAGLPCVLGLSRRAAVRARDGRVFEGVNVETRRIRSDLRRAGGHRPRGRRGLPTGRPRGRSPSRRRRAAGVASRFSVPTRAGHVRRPTARSSRARRRSPPGDLRMLKSGFVAVAGRPNVGRSSLVNALAGGKVAIISDKPQNDPASDRASSMGRSPARARRPARLPTAARPMTGRMQRYRRPRVRGCGRRALRPLRARTDRRRRSLHRQARLLARRARRDRAQAPGGQPQGRPRRNPDRRPARSSATSTLCTGERENR